LSKSYLELIVKYWLCTNFSIT